MIEKVIDVSDSSTPLGGATLAPPAGAADSLPGAPGAPAKEKGPTFADLGLRPDVQRAVDEMGFTEPMPVQAATLPADHARAAT